MRNASKERETVGDQLRRGLTEDDEDDLPEEALGEDGDEDDGRPSRRRFATRSQERLAVETLLNSGYKRDGLPAGPSPGAALRDLLATGEFDGQDDIAQQLADTWAEPCKNLRTTAGIVALQERDADRERVDPLLEQEPGVPRSRPPDPRKSKKQLEDARAARDLVLSDARSAWDQRWQHGLQRFADAVEGCGRPRLHPCM
jgi:hypothetical protein